MANSVETWVAADILFARFPFLPRLEPLLKCLCQTEDEKAVAWHSDARSLERQRIPREFTTKSRVVIISNDWQTLNKNVGMCSTLSPPPSRCTGRRAGGSTMRRFTAGLAKTSTGCGSRRSGTTCGRGNSRPPAWTGPQCSPPRTRTVRARLAAELLESEAYASTAARVQAFVAQGGGCRATFFNYRRKLGNGNGSGNGAGTQRGTGSDGPVGTAEGDN